jgi:hypothetical protein
MELDGVSAAGPDGPGRRQPQPWRDSVPPRDGEYDGPWPDEPGLAAADGEGPESGREMAGTTGFEAGGVLDVLEPWGALAGLIEDVTRADEHCEPGHGALSRLDDDALTGVLRAWRRLESWCAAGGLAAVAELAGRRPTDGALPDRGRRFMPPGESASRADQPPAGQGGVPTGQEGAPGGAPSTAGAFPAPISEFASGEVAAALVLSGQAAERHLDLALGLALRLPGTNRALRAGEIDVLRARIIAEATQTLDAAGAARAEALLLPRVANMTAGQVRAAIARAVLMVDPETARRRREEAAKDARVMPGREDVGTAALCGRDLPPAEVLAADQRITDRARELRAAGLTGTMDELRARAYLDFLLDRPLPAREPGPADSHAADGNGTRADGGGSPVDGKGSPAEGKGSPAEGNGGPDSAGPGDCPPVSVPPGLAARINLTVPLAALLHLNDHPAEAAGFGPLDADVARAIVAAASGNPFTSWCLTLTGPDGRAVGHGCGRRPRHRPPSGRRRAGPAGPRDGTGPPIPDGLSFTITPIAVRGCDHHNESPGYEPSP